MRYRLCFVVMVYNSEDSWGFVCIQIGLLVESNQFWEFEIIFKDCYIVIKCKSEKIYVFRVGRLKGIDIISRNKRINGKNKRKSYRLIK